MITQNVDGLHQAGGARDVVELHGGLDRTVCLGCGDVADRAALDERLQAANPRLRPAAPTRSTPTATPSCPTRCSTGS